MQRVDVKRIDFLHDAAELVVYYDEPRAKATKPQPVRPVSEG